MQAVPRSGRAREASATSLGATRGVSKPSQWQLADVGQSQAAGARVKDFRWLRKGALETRVLLFLHCTFLAVF